VRFRQGVKVRLRLVVRAAPVLRANPVNALAVTAPMEVWVAHATSP